MSSILTSSTNPSCIYLDNVFRSATACIVLSKDIVAQKDANEVLRNYEDKSCFNCKLWSTQLPTDLYIYMTSGNLGGGRCLVRNSQLKMHTQRNIIIFTGTQGNMGIPMG